MNKETIREQHLRIHREHSMAAADDHTTVTVNVVIGELGLVEKLLRELGVTPVAVMEIQNRVKELKELL